MAAFSRKLVWKRARGRCEYCLLPQTESFLPHELDHIRAKKHRGLTTLDNTCVACAYCNGAKGPNAAGYDPVTGDLVPLFNPRTDSWEVHFSTWARCSKEKLQLLGPLSKSCALMIPPASNTAGS